MHLRFRRLCVQLAAFDEAIFLVATKRNGGVVHSGHDAFHIVAVQVVEMRVRIHVRESDMGGFLLTRQGKPSWNPAFAKRFKLS